MNETNELPCLRELDEDLDPKWTCLNDHTSCMWNDGNNGCHHKGISLQPLEDEVS